MNVVVFCSVAGPLYRSAPNGINFTKITESLGLSLQSEKTDQQKIIEAPLGIQ